MKYYKIIGIEILFNVLLWHEEVGYELRENKKNVWSGYAQRITVLQKDFSIILRDIFSFINRLNFCFRKF